MDTGYSQYNELTMDDTIRVKHITAQREVYPGLSQNDDARKEINNIYGTGLAWRHYPSINVTKYGEKTFDYPTGSIVVNDLADDLQLDYGQTDHLEITIKGPMSALEKLTLNKAVSIDLASYTKPGFYQVPVQVKLPDGCSAKEISVSVTLQEKE